MAPAHGGGYKPAVTDVTPTAAVPANARAERIALAALLAGACAIAFAPIFVRLSELGPSATAFWRVAFAAPALLIWLAAERRRLGPAARQPATAKDWWLLGLAGFCFAGDLAFWHWSIKLTSVANSTLLANFAPIFVTPAAWLLFGERIRPAFLAGMALAIAGAGLLMSQSLTLSIDHIVGDGLGVVTAAFYAAYMLTVARLRTVFSTATIMAWSAIATAIFLWPVAFVSGESLIATTAYGWAVLLGLALLSHAGGQSLIAYAFAHLPASFSSVALLLQPAVAALLAWIIFAEPLGMLQALGGAVILGGIVIARRASQR
jgi:drug/metabolite transporter (DMT)-like permease